MRTSHLPLFIAAIALALGATACESQRYQPVLKRKIQGHDAAGAVVEVYEYGSFDTEKGVVTGP